MLNRPVPLTGAGVPGKIDRPVFQTRLTRTACVSACGLCLLMFTKTGAWARTGDAQAQDILKKMNAAYTLTTFQATATLSLKGTGEDNKPFSLSGVQEVAYKSPNLFLIKATGTAVGGTQVRSFDGKTNIFYDSARNQYIKQPAPGGTLPPLSLFGVAVDPASAKTTGTTTVGGHAAYLVQAMLPVPPLRPDATPQEKADQEAFKKTMQPFELAIDKRNYRLLRVAQNAPDSKMTKVLEFTQQAFNPVLGEGAFAFALPVGARSLELRMPEGGGAARRLQASGGATEKPGRGLSPFPPPHASPAASGTSLHR